MIEAVLAYDPGGTTGVAWWSPSMEIPNVLEVPGGRKGMYAYLDSVGRQWDGRSLQLVGEEFRPRPGALTPQLDAVYINGAAEAKAYRHGWGFKLQTPAEAKSFVSNAKLKAVDWYTVGMDHGRDATRHLLLWLCTTPEGRKMGGEELLRRIVAD